ncbi:hypothetical protein FHR83_006805 [Actinoplanes campanulatus]|uniref:Uncharacterized protein n=1 Tax=Actinoplanes campanulatus TaxID=113559 RepID=A0A7W5FHX9_9ACTN|nr:hypothetical protein [Actinoplanes campanulatus]MBB3099099.1 hypothetical protein [Actinoplanes campanulatus]GGN39062.1 hypothetical protein GCM10010109_66540 [Actinoplanes campanulatus]GID40255.1 hypothetical protein Aca09nite_67610 [Actinoplanes campanulatus]
MIWKNPPADQLTTYERQHNAWIVSGDEVQTGDVLVLLGRCFRIDRFTPYEGTVLDDPEARDAWTEGYVLLPVQPGQRYRILPRPDNTKDTP